MNFGLCLYWFGNLFAFFEIGLCFSNWFVFLETDLFFRKFVCVFGYWFVFDPFGPPYISVYHMSKTRAWVLPFRDHGAEVQVDLLQFSWANGNDSTGF